MYNHELIEATQETTANIFDQPKHGEWRSSSDFRSTNEVFGVAQIPELNDMEDIETDDDETESDHSMESESNVAWFARALHSNVPVQPIKTKQEKDYFHANYQQFLVAFVGNTTDNRHMINFPKFALHWNQLVMETKPHGTEMKTSKHLLEYFKTYKERNATRVAMGEKRQKFTDLRHELQGDRHETIPIQTTSMQPRNGYEGQRTKLPGTITATYKPGQKSRKRSRPRHCKTCGMCQKKPFHQKTGGNKGKMQCYTKETDRVLGFPKPPNFRFGATYTCALCLRDDDEGDFDPELVNVNTTRSIPSATIMTTFVSTSTSSMIEATIEPTRVIEDSSGQLCCECGETPNPTQRPHKCQRIGCESRACLKCWFEVSEESVRAGMSVNETVRNACKLHRNLTNDDAQSTNTITSNNCNMCGNETNNRTSLCNACLVACTTPNPDDDVLSRDESTTLLIEFWRKYPNANEEQQRQFVSNHPLATFCVGYNIEESLIRVHQWKDNVERQDNVENEEM